MAQDLIKRWINGNNKNNAFRYRRVVDSTIKALDGNDLVSIDALSSSNINLGSGNDTIYVKKIVGKKSIINGGQGRDTLRLGYTLSQLSLSKTSNSSNSWSIYVTIDNPPLRLDISDIERVRLSDGITLSLGNSITITGTKSGETLSVLSDIGIPNIINAGGGDDTIFSDFGCNATINGGIGDDTVRFNGGNLDYLEVQNGQWTAFSTLVDGDVSTLKTHKLTSVEHVVFGTVTYTLFDQGAEVQGTSWDPIKGTNGSDTMSGSSGNNDFYVGRGNDIIDLSAGGADRIYIDFNYLAALVPDDPFTSPTLTIKNFKGSYPNSFNPKTILRGDDDTFDWSVFSRQKLVTELTRQLQTDSNGYLTGTLKLSWSDSAGSPTLAEASFKFVTA